MNEKLDYATMLEIPINTTNITFSPSKKKKKRKTKKIENVKEVVLEKINSEIAVDAEIEIPDNVESLDNANEVITAETDLLTPPNIPVKVKKHRGFSVIAVQLALIVALIGVITLSNIYVKDSGINTFLNSIFSADKVDKISAKPYNEYKIALPSNLEVTVNGGVMSFSGKGSIFAPADGEISAITKTEDGKFNLEILHSKNFKTVIKGIDYAYCDLGGEVYSNIPIGYSLGTNIEMCFLGEKDAVISNFSLTSGSVVWQV